ncbi:hypothetical protein BJX61DRAFT_542385, partial [Aspergillus egyptiacus]
LGLSVVPFLPYVFDHPVDQAVDSLFRVGVYTYAGEDEVKPLPRHSEVTYSAKDKDEDSTSLSHFHISPLGEEHENPKPSWEEYKEELRREREQRKREREKRGESGILAMLGFGSKKDKTE